jgi:hypothetical protein
MIAFSGGQRTFTGDDGKTYAVEHHPHLYADYHRAGHDTGLEIVDVSEIGADDNSTSPPVVIVYVLRKSGHSPS